jgi:methionine S-methyltransferase
MKTLKSDIFEGMTGSSVETYNSLKSLLDALENKNTRIEARKILHEIVADSRQLKHLDVVTISIQESAPWSNLTLLQLPSTFAPEEWSYTFYEGLNRYPKQKFVGKNACEIGCGNGWISIALAIKTDLNMIYGVDINPKAIVLSKLNLYLNALDSDGSAKTLKNGDYLIDKVIFSESNLLNFFEEEKISLDLITGCIPQVLSPDGD